MLASGMRVGTALGGQQRVRPQRLRQAPVARASSSPQVSAAVAAKRAFNFSAGPAILPLDVLKQAQDEMLDWHGSGMSVLEMSHRGPEFESIIAKAEKDLRALMKIPDNYKARPARAPVPVSRVCPPPGPLLISFSCVWQVLFVQGGASTQFAALPLNFAPEGATIDFVVTGSWGAKCVTALSAEHAHVALTLLLLAPRAAEEAAKYNKVNIAATDKANKFTGAPPGAQRKGGWESDSSSLPPPPADVPAQSTWKLTPGAAYTHICANETIQGVEFKACPWARVAQACLPPL
jgi:phosphoserine aminotransferase